MGHIALYREWRPKTFDEVVEQQYTVAALKQAVVSKNIAHAYLFSGTRGTGKTTMAQVFSRAINCLDPQNGNPCNKCDVCLGILNNSLLDVIEMDAASNNSVDNIRRLCDEVIFSPSVAKYKVYIIDEVHMLSTGAFNALLKTLEEPPAHAVFILATTEQHRIPATILSRCQRYEFRRISVKSIVQRLQKIAEKDKIEITPDALATIAKLSDGALRDAISLLDQAKSAFSGTVKNENILSLVGLVDDEFMLLMAKSIISGNPAKGLELVEDLIMDGRDIVKFTGDLAHYFRNIMICQISKSPQDLINYPEKTIEDIKSISEEISVSRVMQIIKDLSALISDLRWSQNPRIIFEISLVKICGFENAVVEDTVPENPTKETVPENPTKEIVPDEPEEEIDDPFSDSFNNLVEPEVEEAELDVEVKSEVKEEAKPQPNPDVNISLVWPKLLDEIVSQGHMTLYLFLLVGKPTLDGNALNIEFANNDQMNQREVSSNENLRIITDAFKKLTQFHVKVTTSLLADEKANAGKQENSQDKDFISPRGGAKVLEDSANELGINFYKED